MVLVLRGRTDSWKWSSTEVPELAQPPAGIRAGRHCRGVGLWAGRGPTVPWGHFGRIYRDSGLRSGARPAPRGCGFCHSFLERADGDTARGHCQPPAASQGGKGERVQAATGGPGALQSAEQMLAPLPSITQATGSPQADVMHRAAGRAKSCLLSSYCVGVQCAVAATSVTLV